MKIHTDCRHYRVSVPCRFHKQTQVRCEGCLDHAPIEQRILIVKLDAMGDVLRTTACLPPLKRLYPRSHVTWITRRDSRAVLAGNPWIDRVLVVESNYMEFLLSEEFDLALGPDADLLSASITGLARAGTKRGFVADGRGGVVPLNAAAEAWWRMGLDDATKRANQRTYGEWLYAICELPDPVARPSLQRGADVDDRVGRFLRRSAPAARRWVCFNTGASARWEEKRWKQHHYRDLALLMRGHDPSTAVALVGGPGEAEFNAGLLACGAGFIDGGTNNSLEEFAAVIGACDWLLTPDSLGYHVACAVGTPAVCLVGPTSPSELDLYGVNQVIHADLDCIACYLSRCPLATTCMDALTPQVVWPRVSHRTTCGPQAADVIALSGDSVYQGTAHVPNQ
jgi:heptosyltransferase-2